MCKLCVNSLTDDLGKNVDVEVGYKRDCAVFPGSTSIMVYNRDTNIMYTYKMLEWV